MDGDGDRPLRYIVETKKAGRGRYAWSVVAACVDAGDAEYLASAYRDHDRMKARVVDLLEEPTT